MSTPNTWWVHSAREEWMNDQDLHLEPATNMYVAYHPDSVIGPAVELRSKGQYVNFAPDMLPVVISMLTAIQQRIEAGKCAATCQ